MTTLCRAKAWWCAAYREQAWALVFSSPRTARVPIAFWNMWRTPPNSTIANSATSAAWRPLRSRNRLRPLLQHAATILITVLVGGFLGASLVRFSPGFGVDEA